MFYVGFDLNLPQVEHAVEAPVEGDNDNDASSVGNDLTIVAWTEFVMMHELNYLTDASSVGSQPG